MKVSMIGLGKLGLTCAEEMAAKHDVKGYDVLPVQSDKVDIVDSIKQAVEGQDLVFVAVPTPHDSSYDGSQPISQLPNKDFDYSILKNVISEISKYTSEGQDIVVISTVLPGTIRREVQHLISNFNLIYNPYFIAMGTVGEDFLNPEFFTIGTVDGNPEKSFRLREFYQSLIPDVKFHQGTWEEGECIKIFYNTFISFKLSFVNMIQDVSQCLGHINVDVVTEALCDAKKRIISPMYMKAGMGDGGPCHPRDNIALRTLSESLNLGYDLYGSIMISRELQAQRLARFLVGFNNPVVIVGKSFKPGVSLVDGSYSLLVGHFVEQMGGKLEYFDPGTADPGPEDEKPRTYLLGHQKLNWEVTFNAGSIIVDPWRQQTEIPECQVIYYGNTRPQKEQLSDSKSASDHPTPGRKMPPATPEHQTP